MSRRLELAHAYEKALFAGDRARVAQLFSDDIVYWVAGGPRIGGEWRGLERVLDDLWNRQAGLGPGDWVSDAVRRDWYDADDRVIVEISERSWLKTHPEDVMDQRTCVVIRLTRDEIVDLREHPDSHIYEE